MAKRSASPDKLTIKGLSAEDQEWLRAESDRLGCDPENLVRMMIRQRGGPAPSPPQPPSGGRYRGEAPLWEPSLRTPEEMEAYVEPYQSATTINEAEPSLDALMAAGPALLDEPPRAEYRAQMAIPRRMQRKIVPMASPRTPYPRGGFDAFTETEFVGINQAVIGANMMGDGHGNVLRDNLRHFGVKGTVRR